MTYSIGIPGTPWRDIEKKQWRDQQEIKRSYQKDVIDQLMNLQAKNDHFDLIEYGVLDYDESAYPLYALKSKHWDNKKTSALITGGVHGYETSGIHGALAFAAHASKKFTNDANLLILPCISPWGYETINRWNPNAIDPNRSFYPNSPAPESALAMQLVNSVYQQFDLHIDLHETTDTDNLEFRPALAARDGSVHDNWNIPDGFYLVGDTVKPEPDFQKAIINAVAQVTHIAPADENGKIIGAPLEQTGVINYSCAELGLCAGMTNATYRTTTEVYPDSPKTSAQNCIDAQVSAISSALEFVIHIVEVR